MYTVQQLKKALRGGEYTFPGFYPTYFVTSDGQALSHRAARANFRLIIEAMTDERDRSGWAIVRQDINYNDPELFCDVTGERIPSAYAEDQAA